jgi:hypothetical protein
MEEPNLVVQMEAAEREREREREEVWIQQRWDEVSWPPWIFGLEILQWLWRKGCIGGSGGER